MDLTEFIEKEPFRFEVPELDDFVIELIIHEGVLAIRARDSIRDYGISEVGCFMHAMLSLLNSAKVMITDYNCMEAGWQMIKELVEYREKARPHWEPDYLRSLN